MTVRTVVASLLVLVTSSLAPAAVSTQQPAALVVFPLITIEDHGATDTLIQLSNVDDAPRRVACAYDAPTAGPAFTAFTIALLPNQPVAWRASQGLDAVAGGGGPIPAIAAASFTGVLRCVVVDDAGAPTDQNALIATATIERVVNTPQPGAESASYPATGFAAQPGAPNGDRQLVLGGAAAEYDACPQAVTVQALLDGAVFDLGTESPLRREVATTLALATCSARAGAATSASIVFTLVNEFGQLTTFVRTISDQLVVPLSRIDTDMPDRSVFRAANQGSLTGTIRISPQQTGSGVLALALPAFTDPGTGAASQSAALVAQLGPDRDTADVVELPAASPTTQTPTPTPPRCGGDCNGDGRVLINELIVGVNIALDTQPLSACPAFDTGGDGRVTVNELVTAVTHALTSC